MRRETSLKARAWMLAAGLGGVLGTLWGGLVLWGNSPAARDWLSSELTRRLGVPAVVEDLRVSWRLSVRAHGVKVQDPRQQQLLSVPTVSLDWKIPWAGVAPLEIRVEGGQVWFREANWQGYHPPRLADGGPSRPSTSGPTMLLARTDEVAVGAQPLVDVALRGLGGTVQIARFGTDIPFQALTGTVRLLSGEAVELQDLAAQLLGKIPVRVAGRLDPYRAELDGALGPCALQDLAGITPLSTLLLSFGVAVDGTFNYDGSVSTRVGTPPVFAGKVKLADAVLRLGGEPLVEQLSGSWDFRTQIGGVAGALVLSHMRSSIAGLPLVIDGATGRIEGQGGVLRLAQLRGQSPLGALRGAYRLDVRQGLDWSLDLQVNQPKGSWLSGATFLATPATMALRGVALRGDGLDVVLEGEILPEKIDPPTWTMKDVSCYGVLRGNPVQLTELGGSLYVDSQGGHSFSLEGVAGRVMGQIRPDRGLNLWVQREPGASNEAVSLPPPQG